MNNLERFILHGPPTVKYTCPRKGFQLLPILNSVLYIYHSIPIIIVDMPPTSRQGMAIPTGPNFLEVALLSTFNIRELDERSTTTALRLASPAGNETIKFHVLEESSAFSDALITSTLLVPKEGNNYSSSSSPTKTSAKINRTYWTIDTVNTEQQALAEAENDMVQG